jgi:hypothetical protein
MANFYRFSLFNVISFNFLAGNIIVLYALRLGAGNVLIGLIAASYQLTFIFSLIGRGLIGRMGAVKLMGYFWLLRYLLMIPVVLTALPVIREHLGLVLAIVTISVFGFNIAKGIGLTASKPIMGEIPPPRERGAFLANHSLIIHLGAIATSLTMAALLGPRAPVGRYALLLSVGVVAGFGASWFILRLPEPVEAGQGFHSRFADGIRLAFTDRTFRRLNSVNMIAVGVGAMAEAFLVVYLRQLYGYSDQLVVLFVAAGSVGAAIMAVVARSVMDRIGAKPLLFTFTVISVAILVPVAIAPDVGGPWRYLFPALVFFFFSMGRFGILTSADGYFYSITQAEERLDLGIAFGLGSGIAGSLGSFLGGVLLSGLQQALPGSAALPFTIYFSIAALAMLAGVIGVTRMADVDSIRIPDALGILVSPRDLRAIRLLNRLRKSRTEDEEQAAVRALAETTSTLTVSELSEKVSSPSLVIRMEAINSLRNTPLTKGVEDFLIEDVRTHTFTTAHLSAELLGAAGVRRAVPVLREAVGSEDYMVSAKAMLALAQLDDRKSIPAIEKALKSPANARVAIYAAKSLETLGSVGSIPVILDALAASREPFVRDECILSCAKLMGFFDRFYPLYMEFLDDPREGRRSLEDLATGDARLQALVRGVLAGNAGEAGATPVHEAVNDYLAVHPVRIGGTDIGATLVRALRETGISRFERFRFFLGAVLVFLSGDQGVGR